MVGRCRLLTGNDLALYGRYPFAYRAGRLNEMGKRLCCGNEKARHEPGFFKSRVGLRLQDRDRVVDNQTELLDIAFAFVRVGNVPRLTDTERQVFCRTGLNHILGFKVGFVVFAIRAVLTSVSAVGRSVGTIDTATADITGHEAQTWYAESCHVQVVTSLPRTLARTVEVRVLDGVAQEDRVATLVVVADTDVVERRVTVNFLESQGQGVCRQERVGNGTGERGVVDAACFCSAGISGAIQVGVKCQRLAISQWQCVVQVSVVLVPDVLQLGAIQGSTQAVVDGIFAADEICGFSLHASVGCPDRAVVAGVVLAGTRVVVTAFQVQAFDLAAHQADTASSLRQQTGTTDCEHWVLRLHVAEFQLGFREAELNSTTGFAEGVLVFAVTVNDQVARTSIFVRTVKLQAEVAECVDADTDGTLGVAGAVVAPETLGPVLQVVLACFFIAVEIVVANLHVQTATFNEPLRISLVIHKSCRCSQLGTGCSDCQCDCAPLHHSHRDCSFFFYERLFLFGVGETYITQTMVAIVTTLSFRYLYGRVAKPCCPCRKCIAFQ